VCQPLCPGSLCATRNSNKDCRKHLIAVLCWPCIILYLKQITTVYWHAVLIPRISLFNTGSDHFMTVNHQCSSTFYLWQRTKIQGFSHEDGHSMFLLNVGIYTTPKPRRKSSSSSPSWRLQISHIEGNCHFPYPVWKCMTHRQELEGFSDKRLVSLHKNNKIIPVGKCNCVQFYHWTHCIITVHYLTALGNMYDWFSCAKPYILHVTIHRTILKMDLSASEQSPVSGSCKHNNKLSGSIKGGQLLHQEINYSWS
jgi:hypothetical protein